MGDSRNRSTVRNVRVMGRHSAPAGHRPLPTDRETASRPAPSHRARRGSPRAQRPAPVTSDTQTLVATPVPESVLLDALPTPLPPTLPVPDLPVPDPLAPPPPLPVPASMRSAGVPPHGSDPELFASDPSVYELLGLAPTHFTPAPAPPAPASPPPPADWPEPLVIAPVPRPAPAPRPAPDPGPVPTQQPTAHRATLERTAPVAVAETVIEVVPPTAAEVAERESLARRVAALPRVLLDTVAWGGFAAVVALIVIALSDVGMARAALWAVGLSGIVVLAVAVMAVSGARLDELNRAGGGPKRPD